MLPAAPFKDLTLERLENGGKGGHRILPARERVLEILQSENACTEWYRSVDPDPAATFRTLDFELDHKGQEYVLETRGPADGVSIFRNPYVARVIQGNGSDATITINAHGAFFSAMGKVLDQPIEGGPMSFRGGVRMLQVGPYAGNTLNAQVVTLLHEFGHLLDILPQDEGDRDGKSLQNTMEVLRHCRAQIESKVRAPSVLSSR